jgi:DNA-binding transcriptional LysR family regulator
VELHRVRHVVVVASSLNFTHAVKQCNVSPPALPKGVQRLEQALGGQPIRREPQPTGLTDLGREVPRMLERTLAPASTHREDRR